MYFPEDVFKHIMSYIPRPFHPTARIMKQIICEYDCDHSYIFTKTYRSYYIKSKLSFIEYVFKYIIHTPYCMINGLVKPSFPISPGILYDYYHDGINIAEYFGHNYTGPEYH